MCSSWRTPSGCRRRRTAACPRAGSPDVTRYCGTTRRSRSSAPAPVGPGRTRRRPTARRPPRRSARRRDVGPAALTRYPIPAVGLASGSMSKMAHVATRALRLLRRRQSTLRGRRRSSRSSPDTTPVPTRGPSTRADRVPRHGRPDRGRDRAVRPRRSRRGRRSSRLRSSRSAHLRGPVTGRAPSVPVAGR